MIEAESEELCKKYADTIANPIINGGYSVE
jgi:hypothetical protein